MKLFILAASLLLIPLPAHAQEEEVNRNIQMQLLQQNFMARQGITQQTPQNQVRQPDKRTERENEEYRDAVLNAINARKLQLQGRR